MRVSVPRLCGICGSYWRCGCEEARDAAEFQAAVDELDEAWPLMAAMLNEMEVARDNVDEQAYDPSYLS